MRGNMVLMIRSIVVILVLFTLATGCARKMPQEVIDVNRGLGQAKDACAGVYAADDLRSMQGCQGGSRGGSRCGQVCAGRS